MSETPSLEVRLGRTHLTEALMKLWPSWISRVTAWDPCVSTGETRNAELQQPRNWAMTALSATSITSYQSTPQPCLSPSGLLQQSARDWMACKLQNCYFHSLEAGKSKSKVLTVSASSVSGESPLLDHCLSTITSCGGRKERGVFLGPLP